MHKTVVILAMILGGASAPGLVAAQDNAASSNGMFGTPGLIDMPTAQSAPDAELSTSVTYFPGTLRTTLTFQISPRLSGSFRYSAIERQVSAGTLFDRSFDLRYRLVDEGRYRPAVAIGLQDFVGTGFYTSEYIVASKTLGRSGVTVTGGLGWGRLGSFGGMSNPLGSVSARFKTRPQGFTGVGGRLESAKWFRGDAAFFGGVSWQATSRLTLKAEYSSDAYAREVNAGLFQRRSPYNFGLDYKVSRGVHVQAAYLYGSEASVGVTFKLNPKEPNIRGGLGKAPTPVRVRQPSNVAELGWTALPDAGKNIRKAARDQMAAQGLVLEAMSIGAHETTLRIRNGAYTSSAEAVGRTARILSQVMPDSVKTFKIIPVARGIKLSQVTLRRADLEVLEHHPENSRLSYEAARITDVGGQPRPQGMVYSEGLYPRLRWGIGPYMSTSYFDPDSPVRAEVGVQANAAWDISPGLVLSGNVRMRAGGNKHTATRPSDSVIRKVRSDSRIYDREGNPAIKDLTLSYHFRPGRNLYGRVTAGYLETMYGGISTELLWKPVDSRFALGAEVNYVKQRDFDQLFGFQPYEVTTGHLTAYWDMNNGYYAQGSVGRYLGGDVGGTLKIERIFKNGWRVGAYATLTDVSFSDFGEGSFDKGLTFTVPLDHFMGTPNRKYYNTVLQPLTRDGGARLAVKGRLYDTVRSYHDPELKDSWGRFWR